MARATSMGERESILDSAVYFDGPNMNPSRVQNLTKIKHSITSKKAYLQMLRVTLLEEGKHCLNMANLKIEQMI